MYTWWAYDNSSHIGSTNYVSNISTLNFNLFIDLYSILYVINNYLGSCSWIKKFNVCKIKENSNPWNKLTHKIPRFGLDPSWQLFKKIRFNLNQIDTFLKWLILSQNKSLRFQKDPLRPKPNWYIFYIDSFEPTKSIRF